MGRILTSCPAASFPRVRSAVPGASGLSPWVSSWTLETRGGKIIFLYGECLSEPFLPRAPPKWMSISGLKGFHCDTVVQDYLWLDSPAGASSWTSVRPNLSQEVPPSLTLGGFWTQNINRNAQMASKSPSRRSCELRSRIQEDLPLTSRGLRKPEHRGSTGTSAPGAVGGSPCVPLLTPEL